MDPSLPRRLSQIKTNWLRLFAMSEAPTDTAEEISRQLLIHYSDAVYQYLLGAVRDVHVADDLAQEFAVRFLRGDFLTANPRRGRFRDFVKRSLSNLVSDHYRLLKRERDSLRRIVPRQPTEAQLDGEFDESWKRELLKRSWSQLQDFENSSGTPYCIVLKLKAEHPDLSTDQLIDRLAEQTGTDRITTGSFRQTPHRARGKFRE